MSDHPTHLLAEYVEGTLDPQARARVDAHVSGCRVCSEEVVAARYARAALSSLPEAPAPEALALEVRRRTRGPAPSRSRARWIGVAAAAAVVIAGAVIVGTRLVGNEPGQPASGPGPGEAGTEPREGAPGASPSQAAAETAGLESIPVYRESNRDYMPADLARLGSQVRGRVEASLAAGLPPTATGFYASFDPGAFTGEVRQAIECATRDVPPDQLVVPFEIEAARFEGSPAYVASFLQGPAPEEPYDRIVFWVADRETCELLSLASQRL